MIGPSRSNVALLLLAGVACTTVVGLPDLPELDEQAATGGTTATGGSNSNGGTTATGGSTSSGGTSATGGAGATGGSDSSGGADATGGSDSNGGTSANGGSDSNGGASATAGSDSNGGTTAMGGAAGAGAEDSGGSSGTGGSDMGGTSGAGGSAGGSAGASAGMSGASGSGGSPPALGPCDIYAAASTPCVGAYSTIRRLSSTYSGPLYQVRSGSSAQNTGSGGETHDIGMTADGFADAAAQDEVCSATTCTISRLYDQSGNGNHLSVAKRGNPAGGMFADQDDFESLADGEELTVDGHTVYSLYMEVRQGYRLPAPGTGVARGTAAQGIYMLANGTRVGTACCWDFGNVTANPTQYAGTNALFFGTAYWGSGAGSGPWFMADFGSGVWAGGSDPGDPGWGEITGAGPANTNNPSLRVRFALGFLKTDATRYALRMADAATATSVTTAYQGAIPLAMDNQGAIVLGVAPDNSNNSWGTFYEGAVLSGFPTDAAELEVLQNIRAAGYGQ